MNEGKSLNTMSFNELYDLIKELRDDNFRLKKKILDVNRENYNRVVDLILPNEK
jgi:hypothetical protein